MLRGASDAVRETISTGELKRQRAASHTRVGGLEDTLAVPATISAILLHSLATN